MIDHGLQVDEAQHGHYNDGYNPYSTAYEPQPYQNQGGGYGTNILPDPFSSPPQHGGPFVDHPHDAYGGPISTPGPPPPLPPHQIPGPPPHIPGPPPQAPGSSDYLSSGYNRNPLHQSPSQPTLYTRNSYELNDDGVVDEDTGDIPLLRRDGSTSTYAMPHVPGGYEEIMRDDRSENNIRYGRIPQRVPRRYKTVKRVE